jgi:hypothetical protein
LPSFAIFKSTLLAVDAGVLVVPAIPPDEEVQFQVPIKFLSMSELLALWLEQETNIVNKKNNPIPLRKINIFIIFYLFKCN